MLPIAPDLPGANPSFTRGGDVACRGRAVLDQQHVQDGRVHRLDQGMIEARFLREALVLRLWGLGCPPSSRNSRSLCATARCRHLIRRAAADARPAHAQVAARHRDAAQHLHELAFHHVGRRQPGTGVGDQNFLRRPEDLGSTPGLAMPVKTFQGTPAFPRVRSPLGNESRQTASGDPGLGGGLAGGSFA
jgi:hypothetical protein